MFALHPAKRSSCGFTLVELTIVLGVIGTVMGAIWVAWAATNQSNKVQQALRQIIMAESGYKSIYVKTGIDSASGCLDYAGRTTDVTCMGVNGKLWSNEMLNPAACVTGTTSTYPLAPWGDNSIADANTCYASGGNTVNSVVISYYNLPQAACSNLAQALFNLPTHTYEAISPDGVTFNAHWVPPATSYTSTQINGFCGAASTNVVRVGFPVQ